MCVRPPAGRALGSRASALTAPLCVCACADPHEEELCVASAPHTARMPAPRTPHTTVQWCRLFPPCTGLSCSGVSKHGAKRCLLVNAQVSTARLDTKELSTPSDVPGTADALRWAAELTGCGVDELAAKEKWDLQGKNLTAREHVEKLALLIGRASASAMPMLTELNLTNTQLGDGGAALLAEGLKVSGSLKEVCSASAQARPRDLTVRCVTHS